MRSLQRLFVSAIVLSLAVPATAQVASDAVLRGFEPTGDFFLQLDGEDLLDAEIFFAQRAVAYLIMTPKIDWTLMVSPRTGIVEKVPLMKVHKKADGTIDILADAVLTPLGGFDIDPNTKTISWMVGDKQAKLKPRSWLLGRHAAKALAQHDPSYAFKASKYTPKPAPMAALAGLQKDVKVVVYFGSWCPVCKRMLPNVLRVSQDLEGSRLKFEYYGLPKPFDGEPEAEKDNIHGVPTAVVFDATGKELGRLAGNELAAPEASLSRLLDPKG